MFFPFTLVRIKGFWLEVLYVAGQNLENHTFEVLWVVLFPRYETAPGHCRPTPLHPYNRKVAVPPQKLHLAIPDQRHYILMLLCRRQA